MTGGTSSLPTPLQRRIIDAAADLSECTDSPEYLHAVLCQVGLPRRKQAERVFERRSGNAALRLEAGSMFVGPSKPFVELPLPYGSRPRLVLYHICSEAIRTQSKQIDIGRSIADFFDKLGICPGGHEYTRFKNQMQALCGVRMTLGFSDATRFVTIDTKPVHRFDAWLHYDGRQLGMWPGYLELSQEFLDTLLGHAVPLDPRAIAALKDSALALDLYTWLAHRLCRVRQDSGVKVSWNNLRQQFGQEYQGKDASRNFKKEFAPALAKVCAVYPEARVEKQNGGFVLYPSKPPVPKSQVLMLGA